MDSDLEELYDDVMAPSRCARLGNRQLEGARDVVQEAFAQALRDQERIPRRRVARGVGVADRVSSCGRMKGSRELALDEVPEVALVHESRDPALAAAVRELPPQRRVAIFLRYFADLSSAEIGEVLGITKARSPRRYPQAQPSLLQSFQLTR